MTRTPAASRATQMATRPRGRRAAGGRNAANRGAAAMARGEPTEEELIQASISLLQDELRPYGRLLRKRLGEEMAAPTEVVPLARLRQLCVACDPKLVVEQEGEAEWFVKVEGVPENVVDVYAEEDTFSETFWHDAAVYLRNLPVGRLGAAGGRYVCARNLQTHAPAFLQGLSLGKVTQFVQLAMTRRKLLGYCHGAIVPYDQSDAMVKEQCAEQRMLTRETADPPLESWELLRQYLREVLDGFSTVGKAKGGVPLSNIKRLIRNRFHVDLSETALGHRSLADLFKDERLKDICAMRLLDNGYYLYPAVADSPTSAGSDDNLQDDSRSEASTVSPCRQSQATLSPKRAANSITSTTPTAAHKTPFCLQSSLPVENTFAPLFPSLDAHWGATTFPTVPTMPLPLGDASERQPVLPMPMPMPVAPAAPMKLGDAGDRQVPQQFWWPWLPQVSNAPAPIGCSSILATGNSMSTPLNAPTGNSMSAQVNVPLGDVKCTPTPFEEGKFDLALRAAVEEEDETVADASRSNSSLSGDGDGISDSASNLSSVPPTARDILEGPKPTPSWFGGASFSEQLLKAAEANFSEQLLMKRPWLPLRAEGAHESDNESGSDASCSIRVRNTFIDVAEMSPASERSPKRSHSMPRSLGR
eukprot:TRINITY_DN6702_c0_g5_i1.p1 TRINITY_DN6702_c0_g5~~TRINITY_DN6702_c0_g5_i1.p1  ORF type:complete len:645 (-),score=119.65 TRINITY_DN6702_c0_g5_i1:140-2074(-)